MSIAHLGLAGDQRPAGDSGPARGDRVPPHDLLAEQSAIGGMLLSKDAVADVIETVRAVDFYIPKHEVIFDAILALYQNGKRAEAVQWLQRSARRGEPRAQFVLGTMYFNGEAVGKDWVRAYALMTRSSGAGLPQGSQTLAEMDKYIPAEQRQQGIELAHKMDAQIASNTNYAPEVAGGGPGGPAIMTTDLPPSSAAGPIYGQPGAPYPAPGKTRPGKNRPPVLTANPPQTYNPAPAYNPAPTYTPSVPAPRPVPVPVRPAPAPAPAPVRVASGGGWRVQFGAFRDEGNAKVLWTRLKGEVAGLSGMQPYLRRVGPITKLQAGPLRSQADAARLCATVKRAGSECVPVAP